MTAIRRALAGLAAAAAFAAGAPAAGAATAPISSASPPGIAGARATPLSALDGVGALGVPGGCNTVSGPEGQGGTGEARTQVCLGAGLSFIGPSVAQIATVIGPTTIGGQVFIGNSIVSGGAAAGGV